MQWLRLWSFLYFKENPGSFLEGKKEKGKWDIPEKLNLHDSEWDLDQCIAWRNHDCHLKLIAAEKYRIHIKPYLAKTKHDLIPGGNIISCSNSTEHWNLMWTYIFHQRAMFDVLIVSRICISTKCWLASK